MSFEAFFSMGITIEYFRCCEDKSDFYQDPDCKWEDAVKLSAVFDDNPKIKVLKDLGWFTEDEDIKPQLIYLPMYIDWTKKEILDVRDNSLIRIHYFGQQTPSEFRITDKRMDSVYGVYWVCKLAPERLNNFYETTDNGTHYLKKKQDREEGCEHILSNDGEDNREYQHDDYEEYVNNAKNTTGEDVDDYSSIIMDNDNDNYFGGLKK